MHDREKVIKGLSICNCLTDICYEHDCPYYNGMKEICGEIEDVGYSSDDCMKKLHNDALAMLKEQETANLYKCPNCGTWVSAENVVRCKDCKNYKDGKCFYTMRRHGLEDDWFCADGERKEGR